MQNPDTELLTLFLDSIQVFTKSSESLDTNLLSSIFNLISEAYGSTNNDYRKEREVNLSDLKASLNWKNYALNLYQIICFSGITQKDALERVLIDLKSTVQKRASLEPISLNDLVILVAANVYTLTSREFSIRHMDHLAKALKGLFDVDLEEKSYLQRVLEHYLISTLQNATNAQVLSILFILKQIVESGSLTNLDLERLEIYIQTLSNLSLFQLSQLQLPIRELTKEFTLILEIVYYCSDLTKTVLDKLLAGLKRGDFNKAFFFERNSSLQQIINLSEKILEIDLTGNNIKIVSTSTLKELDDLVNRTKKNAIKNLRMLLDYTFMIRDEYEVEFSEQQKSLVNTIIQNFTGFLKFFLTQIHSLVALQFSVKTDFSITQNNLISESFTFLSLMVDKYEYYDIFLDNRTEVIVNVIINLLLTTKLDHATLDEDPKTFTQDEQDMVENREGETLRTSTAQFFYKFCEKIDGTLSWITTFLLKSINLSLDQPGDYNDLVPFQNSLFFSVATPVSRIETSLICMAILTKQITIREDLIKELDKFLMTDFKLLFNIDSVIVKCRICLFMKEMIPILFQRNDHYFKETVKYLFECLLDWNNPAVSYQALFSLEFIINKGNEYNRVRPVVTDMMDYIEKMIDEANEDYYFDFLTDILDQYEEEIMEDSTKIVRRLCARTWKEFQALGNERSNIVIAKCLATIRSMVASRDLMESNFVDFEDDLQNLFTLLDGLHRINFEEDLISIATEVARNVAFNSSLFVALKRNLVKILEKNDFNFGMFFELFYHWCMNGCLFILTDYPELLVEMVKVCLRSLEHYKIPRIQKEYKQFSMICLSLQIIIQSFGEQALSPMIKDIIFMMNKVLQQITSDIAGVSCFRFLHVYYNLLTECTADTLVHLKNANFLELLIKKEPLYFLEYFKDDQLSRKIISSGLCAILFNRKTLELSSELMHYCFVNLIKILADPLTITRKIQAKNQIRESEGERKPYFEIDSSLYQDDAIICLSLTSQDRELREILKRLDFPVMRSDEFFSFAEVFKDLQGSNKNFIDSIWQNLDADTIESLKEILMTKNFTTEENNKMQVRKSVKVKSKTNTQGYDPAFEGNTNNLMGQFNPNNKMTE